MAALLMKTTTTREFQEARVFVGQAARIFLSGTTIISIPSSMTETGEVVFGSTGTTTSSDISYS